MDCYVALGSNLGDRVGLVREAVRRLGCIPGIRRVTCSALYLTKPWGIRDQPEFVNAVARLETTLEPIQLLIGLQQIEQALGRERRQRWGPREIDLDLLLYGDRQIHRRGLVVPHPRMLERAFVLVPLRDVWIGDRLPSGITIEQALAGLAVEPEVKRLDEGSSEVVVR